MALDIRINKKFLKDLAQLPDGQRKKIEVFVFHEAKNFHSLSDIPSLRKLKGYKSYYRIRFGEYRVGLSIRNNVLTFERLLHRKDIYKYYP